MNKEKLVLVGNGMAGVRTLEELIKTAPDMYDITVFGAEPYGNYNRILLSPVLAGEKTFDEIVLNDEAWYTENGITLYKGREITAIDRRARKVVAGDGTVAPYDPHMWEEARLNGIYDLRLIYVGQVLLIP